MFYTADFTWGASGPSNNGNLLRALQYLPNGEDQITSFAMNNEDYTYDSLNRLTSASEGSTYKQSYIYDRYGNRTIDAANTSGGVNAQQFSVTASNNRLGVPGGQSGTMTYDGAGNLINDTYSGQGQRTYDAENRMTGAQDIYSGWTYYTYDAGGSRVRRKINNQETWQIYGIGGELVAEYAANASPSSPQKEYGYRGGQLLVTATNTTNDIQWLVTDQLGTPRMIFDKTGSLAGTKRHDYLPFGEELFAGIGSRSAALGYGVANDGVRQKFTQKERDNETGLDFFKARYYGSPQGRFTSPDPYNIIFEKEKGRDEEEKDEILTIYISNPQVWNRYTYTLNNPLNVVDPDGRRALTRQEEQDIEKLRKQAEGKSAADAKAINNAADAMVNAIHAVRTGQKDPQGLGIALKAIHQIGNTRYGYQGAGLSVSRNGITIHATSGEWKCNIFVAAMHIVGVPTGLGPNGFPTVTGQHGEDLAPSANQLGNPRIGLGHLQVVTGSPQMGDVVAFPTSHGLGHSSIALSSNVVIYAGGDDVTVNTIQTTGDRLGHSATTVRRFKP